MLRTNKIFAWVSSAALTLSLASTGYYLADTINGKNTTLADQLRVISFCPYGTALGDSVAKDGKDGVAGPAGSVGSAGPAGAAGAAGEDGEPGATGQTGAAGPKGDTGKTGTSGATGIQGAAGATGEKGETGAAGAPGVSGVKGETGAAGATGPSGVAGAQGPAGICTGIIDLTAITGDLIPSIDNAYSLGTAQFRWKGLQLGPGTLYIEDQTTGQQAGLTVDNGTLLIDGADSLRLGNIRLTSTGLKSVLANQDITIGETGDTGYLAVASGIKFVDGTIMTSASSVGGGATGPQGPAGPVGPAGATGATGATGPQGPAGSNAVALIISNPISGSTIDVSKTAVVLSSGTFQLPDAPEGTRIYFAAQTGAHSDQTSLVVAHLRTLLHGAGSVSVNSTWFPFTDKTSTNPVALAVAVFLNGAWNVSYGSIG